MPTIAYYKADVPNGDWKNENPFSLHQHDPDAIDYGSGRWDLAYYYSGGSTGLIHAMISFLMPGPLTPGTTINSATLYISLWGSFDSLPRWEPIGAGTTLTVRIRRVLPVNEWDTAAPGGPTYNAKHRLVPNNTALWAGGPGCDNVGTDLGAGYNDTSIFRGNPWTDSHYTLNCTNAVQEAVNAGDTRIRIHLQAIGGSSGKLTFRKNGNVAPDLGPGFVVGPSMTMTYDVNAAPTPPTSLLLYQHGSPTGGTNPVNVDDFTPEFDFICNDPDSGDILTHYEIQVNTKSTFIGTDMWSPGKQAFAFSVIEGNRCVKITYAGTTLKGLTTYYWRVKVWDNEPPSGTEGAWSTTAQFTTASAVPLAPTSLRVEGSASNMGVLTQFPGFDFVHNDPNPPGEIAAAYHIQVNTQSNFLGVDLWNTGTVPFTGPTSGNPVVPPITYAGSTLQVGITYYWRVMVWDAADNTSPWSAFDMFELDKLTPQAPTGLWINDMPSGAETGDNLHFTAVYEDPNPPGDQAVHYQLQVNNQEDFNGRMMWDSGKTALTTPISIGSRCEDIGYEGYRLTQGHTYWVRLKFWDNEGHESPWSMVI